MDENPLSQRETFKAFFPAWLVDYVIAPFPDEVGWLAVGAKWFALGALSVVLLPGLPDELAISAVVFGLLGILYASSLPKN